MKVIIDNRSDYELPSDYDPNYLVLHALEHMECPQGCEVSLSVVNEEEIQQLNTEYRGVENVTDVLSFECDSPWDVDEDSDELVEVGDIVICPSVIEEQSKQFGTTFTQELSLMTVHSVLHLLGYDHMNDEERAEMEALEKEILDSFGITGVR